MIGEVYIENFGLWEGIVKVKMEIIDGFVLDGLFVVFLDELLLIFLMVILV